MTISNQRQEMETDTKNRQEVAVMYRVMQERIVYGCLAKPIK